MEDPILQRLHKRIMRRQEQAKSRVNLKRKMALMKATESLIVQFKRRKKELKDVSGEGIVNSGDGKGDVIAEGHEGAMEAITPSVP